MQISKEDTFQQIGFKGEGRVTWDIPGWDRESLDLKVSRDQSWSTDEVHWKFDIEVPRWGRSRDKVKSDYQAHKKILEAYAEAMDRMKDWEGRQDELEAEFQKGEAIRKAEKERKEAERLAAIEADKPVGMKLAKTICEAMIKQARASDSQESKEIVFQTRGEHKEHKMRCMYTWSKLTLFNVGWNRISRKDAIRMLADAWLNSVDTGDIKDNIPDARLAKFMMGGVAK
jgi:hypothetical protein